MVSDVDPGHVETVVSETRLVFVDCWAPWCGPCLALAPTLEELDQKYSDNEDVKFLKVNTQNYMEFATENSIHAIPCVLVFFDGKPASFEYTDPRTGKKTNSDRLIGLRPPEHYEMVIKQLLK